MLSNKSLLIILIILIVSLIPILFLLFQNKTSNNNLTDVKLPNNDVLAKNNDFYENHKKTTLDYLIAVYPNGKDSLEKLSTMDLAKFYNSLWFYYNCASKFNQDLILPINGIQTSVKSCWEEIPGCGDKFPKLPYAPQGDVYSFNDWVKNWTPWINSNSDIDYADITGSFPGQTFSNWYNGPSPVWMYQRAIFRMVYNTELPSINYMNENPRSYPSLLTGNNGDWESKWNYPNNWWNCIPDNGYIEVTCASEPGMASSPPILWIDGWPGSGIFFNVGKSFRAKNKSSAAFFLAKEMTKTTDGSKKLKEWFNSDDPYEILKNLIYGYSKNNYKFSNINGPSISDSKGNVIKNCNILYNAQSNPASLPFLPINKNIGAKSQSRDWGFWGVEEEQSQNFYSWCNDAKDNQLDYIPNSCIDDIVQDNNYPAGRLNNTTLFDEVSFAMGLWLGYDSIQMSMSPNGAGFWQYEIMVLYDYPEKAKDRDYSDFIEIDINNNINKDSCPVYTLTNGQPAVGGVKYKDNFTTKYMENITKYFTLRDPLDIYNDKKATNIILDSIWKPDGPEYNITVKDHISSMFTGASILGLPNNQCNNDNIYKTVPRSTSFRRNSMITKN